MLGCPVPDVGGVGVGWVLLRISLDSALRTKSQSAVLLRITDRCPAGSYCKNGQIRECPTGHECPGEQLEQSPRLCPLGYFQDTPGAEICRTCP